MLLAASKIYVAIAPPTRSAIGPPMPIAWEIGAAKLEQPEEHQHQRHVFDEVGVGAHADDHVRVAAIPHVNLMLGAPHGDAKGQYQADQTQSARGRKRDR